MMFLTLIKRWRSLFYLPLWCQHCSGTTQLFTHTGAPGFEIQSREKEKNIFHAVHFPRSPFIFLPSPSCPVTLLAYARSESTPWAGAECAQHHVPSMGCSALPPTAHSQRGENANPCNGHLNTLGLHLFLYIQNLFGFCSFWFDFFAYLFIFKLINIVPFDSSLLPRCTAERAVQLVGSSKHCLLQLETDQMLSFVPFHLANIH